MFFFQNIVINRIYDTVYCILKYMAAYAFLCSPNKNLTHATLLILGIGM